MESDVRCTKQEGMKCIARRGTPVDTPSWISAVLTSITTGQTLFLVDTYEDDGTPISRFPFRYVDGSDLNNYMVNEIRPACLLVESGAFSMYVDDPIPPLELEDFDISSDVLWND